jgi:hypothetical protein
MAQISITLPASACLRVIAGPFARRRLGEEGLRPEQIVAVAAAAGGPKGLMLGPIDRYVFGEFLLRASQPVDLIGASIGCWRLAAACCRDPAAKLRAFSEAYIGQHYRIPPGRRRPDPSEVSASFARGLEHFFGPFLPQLVQHPRYRLHVLTSLGVGLLGFAAQAGSRTLAAAFAAAWVANAIARSALAGFLRRVVFLPSAQRAAQSPAQHPGIDWRDYPHHQVELSVTNVLPAMQASCSIPMVLDPVHNIPGAPAGPHWDGGLTDYHLHLDYRELRPGLVLYPHFHPMLIPGWLDKAWASRHRASPKLDNVVVLAPAEGWIAQLPDGRFPDRGDFERFAHDPRTRMQRWRQVLSHSQALADALEAFVRDPGCIRVEALEAQG